MKQVALILAVVLTGVLAQAEFFGTKVEQQLASQENPSCGLNKQGGPIDGFPWSVAQPFPWNTIQGLWKVSDSPDQVMRMRVVRQDQNAKHLSVDVMSRNQCNGPVMMGVGIVTAAEKNVVRLTLTDKQGQTYMMKLAMFDTADLQMDKNLCGQSVLAASVITLDNEGEDDITADPANAEQSNMMLKKITNSTDFYCRKRK